jgi:hypothetical protein
VNHFYLVFGAGFLAGAMNAVAGGGTFVALPALIAAGVPSVQANASSTVALFPGALVSAWAYRSELGPVGTTPLRRLIISTALGGVIGALLLLWTPVRTFDVALPWLLLLATLALGFGRRVGTWLSSHWSIGSFTVIAIQFFLGIYGGYFGGAVGIMMVALWSLLGHHDLRKLNATRTLLLCAANIMAVLTFIIARAVYWPETSIMLVAAALGGYGGAQLGRRASPTVLRMVTLSLTGFITICFFIRAYGDPWR